MAGKFHTVELDTVPTFVLNVATNTVRADHMTALLNGIDMQRWRLFPALSGEGYIRSATKSLLVLFDRMLTRETFEPFLLLEDDVMVTPWTQTLQLCVPDDADAVYVGLSTCSAHPDADTHMIGVPYEPVRGIPDVVRLLNMLSQHAVYICSRRWLALLLRTMTVGCVLNLNWDIPTARHMHDYRVYGMTCPIFFQDARLGGQQEPTLVCVCPKVAATHGVPVLPALPWRAAAGDLCHQYEPPSDLKAWNDV